MTEKSSNEMQIVTKKILSNEVYFVPLNEAALWLGISASAAYASYHSAGFLVDGVPIYKSGQRRFIVATQHLRDLIKPIEKEQK